ncbi:DNA-directed RNA polymerase subunit [Rhynchospora pubera]|uniref:DNA-directed RNA polymerase subunit n=2 Tax=Rhynchospora pubera TaxID=906938 RepID=A0AAV8FKZ1_9POAL|nr:DNA-directed RNA polymerase subunit [Rhynchospora pubera]KAJ4791673.1 DNA-directed RNA polymerase subunit [Rhynchospora pubera]
MDALKFCRECNNILYPKEEKDIRQLIYACRNCDYQEESGNNIVYKMEIRKPSTEDGTGVLKDAISDASLPRTRSVKCANCNHSEAVFFQAAAKGEEGLALFFVCCNPNCGHRWRD